MSGLVSFVGAVSAVIVALLGVLTAHVTVAQVSSDTPDLAIYARIRDEGTARSHVMMYASDLMDGIGPRLTGSPGLERAFDEIALKQDTADAGANIVLDGLVFGPTVALQGRTA